MSGILTVLITTLHILACISLMVAILLQSGKGGGLAGTFGAGSSQTLFGGRGAATFLSRAAGTLAVVFFLTSLTLGLTASRQGVSGGRSLITEEAKRRAGQGQRPVESNAPPPLGGATAPGQGLTPPAATPEATPPAATTPPATTAPAPRTSTAPAKKAPAAQPPAASTTQPPAQEAPATNAPSTNTTEPTPPATEGNTTTQGGQ